MKQTFYPTYKDAYQYASKGDWAKAVESLNKINTYYPGYQKDKEIIAQKKKEWGVILANKKKSDQAAAIAQRKAQIKAEQEASKALAQSRKQKQVLGTMLCGQFTLRDTLLLIPTTSQVNIYGTVEAVSGQKVKIKIRGTDRPYTAFKIDGQNVAVNKEIWVSPDYWRICG